MFRTLRDRLIASHVLPLIIIIPLAGIALVYFLETEILLPRIGDRVTSDARLIAAVTRDQTSIWSNPGYAQGLLSQSNPNPTARAMLFDTNGRLLDSTDPADHNILGQVTTQPNFYQALQGQTVKNIQRGQSLDTESMDIWVPVIDSQHKLVGVVRVTYYFSSVYAELLQLRSIIIMILLGSLLVGVGMGLILALSINRPIQKVTGAVYDLAYGNLETLPETDKGVKEFQILSEAIDFLARRLQNLERYRQQLLANLVHELGRSLGALRTADLALIRGALKDPQFSMELARGMEDEINSLQRLLEDLSHLHQQDVLGILELERQPVQISDWLEKISSAWQETAREKGVQWYTDIPKNLPEIEADPVRLSQALGNLLSNAVKFTPKGGSVFISAGAEDTSVWVKVSDSGPGIPQEEQEKIFTPFYRGKQGKRFAEGMGLGLGIARDLVVAHGGRLVMESVPQRGSTFTIWLPENVKRAVRQLQNNSKSHPGNSLY